MRKSNRARQHLSRFTVREIILVVFPLFSRKSANALQVSDFEETVQTQYLITIFNKLQTQKEHKRAFGRSIFLPPPQTLSVCLGCGPNGSNGHGSKLPGQSRKVPGRIEKQVKTNMDERERCVTQTGLEQTCVAPSTRGWWARGAKNSCAGGGFCCSVCVRGGRSWLLGG